MAASQSRRSTSRPVHGSTPSPPQSGLESSTSLHSNQMSGSAGTCCPVNDLQCAYENDRDAQQTNDAPTMARPVRQRAGSYVRRRPTYAASQPTNTSTRARSTALPLGGHPGQHIFESTFHRHVPLPPHPWEPSAPPLTDPPYATRAEDHPARVASPAATRHEAPDLTYGDQCCNYCSTELGSDPRAQQSSCPITPGPIRCQAASTPSLFNNQPVADDQAATSTALHVIQAELRELRHEMHTARTQPSPAPTAPDREAWTAGQQMRELREELRSLHCGYESMNLVLAQLLREAVSCRQEARGHTTFLRRDVLKKIDILDTGLYLILDVLVAVHGEAAATQGEGREWLADGMGEELDTPTTAFDQIAELQRLLRVATNVTCGCEGSKDESTDVDDDSEGADMGPAAWPHARSEERVATDSGADADVGDLADSLVANLSATKTESIAPLPAKESPTLPTAWALPDAVVDLAIHATALGVPGQTLNGESGPLGLRPSVSAAHQLGRSQRSSGAAKCKEQEQEEGLEW